jgi:hypothetical protein
VGISDWETQNTGQFCTQDLRGVEADGRVQTIIRVGDPYIGVGNSGT